MAMLPIRIFGDPVLRDVCPDATDPKDLEDLIRDMIDSLPRPVGAGLSANQIGVMKRVFIYEDEDEIKVCINPRIISVSEDMEEAVEGCLSLPGIGVPVNRHLSLELEYSDLSGETLRLEVEGWLARVFQHEIDHLEGKLILDRTDRESRVEALEELQGGLPPIHPHDHGEHAL
jgi:peptide deformylase